MMAEIAIAFDSLKARRAANFTGIAKKWAAQK